MIKNTPSKTDDQHIEDLRAAIEHRATWFALLVEEARKKGLDESFAREAIFKCGCLHGQTKFPRTANLKEFGEAFANDNVVKIFEMDVKVADEEELDIDFHYCPLVAAWLKMGLSNEDIALFCDIGMDGDRGIINEYDEFDFELGETIATGHDCCDVKITKKNI